jgi:hypothetical protein
MKKSPENLLTVLQWRHAKQLVEAECAGDALTPEQKDIIHSFKQNYALDYSVIRERVMKKKGATRVELGELIRVCPGGKHAIYQSNVGHIRKQICHGTL